MAFSCWFTCTIIVGFCFKFHWHLFSWWSTYQRDNFDSDNCLVSNRRQDIMWTNVEPMFTDTYTSYQATVCYTYLFMITMTGICHGVLGAWWQERVWRAGTSNYIPQILWDVMICPCPWYILLTQQSWFPFLSRWWCIDFSSGWALILEICICKYPLHSEHITKSFPLNSFLTYYVS